LNHFTVPRAIVEFSQVTITDFILIDGWAANAATELCTSKTLAVSCSHMANTAILAFCGRWKWPGRLFVLSENLIRLRSRIVGQNHRRIADDVRDPAFARNVRYRLLQVARRLEAENLFLRHQLGIALRHAPPRVRLRGSDRALMVWLTWLWPSLLGAAHVVKPETILRWHRAGFTAFWRWKSRKRAGRPKIDQCEFLSDG
jgi:hypothetical protein